MRFQFSNLNIASTLLLTASLILWVVNPTAAQEGSDGEAEEFEENVVCIEEIALPAIELYNDMTTFLGTHYQGEDNATDLLETTLIKFEEYEANMDALVEEYSDSQSGHSIEQEALEAKNCREFVELKKKEVEQVMRNHHLQNAGAKTTYHLVEKLKDINDGLREMNQSFGEMYAYFSALKNKLTNTTE